MLQEKSPAGSRDDKVGPVLINVVPVESDNQPPNTEDMEDLQLEDVENLPGQGSPAKQSPTRSSVRFPLVKPEKLVISSDVGKKHTSPEKCETPV